MVELSRKSGFRKYQVNKNAFLDENDISFYLLGVYFTDGHINDCKRSISFCISSKDDIWLETIRNIICPLKPIYKKKTGCFSLEVSEIDCMNWLIQWGCTPRKAKTVSISKPIPLEYQRDFLRGVIDGDGSLSHSRYSIKKNNKTYNYIKKSLYICSVSEVFINQLKDMIPSDIKFCFCNLGKRKGSINGRVIESTTDMFRLIFNDSNAVKFGKYTYYAGNSLSLTRKENIVYSWLNQ